ncbi:MAG: hypothetical protein B6I30_06195 [Desulfobacteraceae bacterium 4572_187]|nr:MAG: hypothetical protein B6I30_06195 [Desulfobacteraceae bacterium 4572_187]
MRKKITTPVRSAGPTPVEHPEGPRFNKAGQAQRLCEKTINQQTHLYSDLVIQLGKIIVTP